MSASEFMFSLFPRVSIKSEGNEHRAPETKMCRCVKTSVDKQKVEGSSNPQEIYFLSQTSVAVLLPPTEYARCRKDRNNSSLKTGMCELWKMS